MKKHDNTVMYIKDLAGVLQINLMMMKQRYTHSQHCIKISLFSQLGIFFKNWPSVLLNLCYSDIAVNLLWDLSNRPH